MSADQSERGPCQILQELDAGLSRILVELRLGHRASIEDEVRACKVLTIILLGEGDAWGGNKMHRKTTEEILSPDPRTPTHRSE